MEKTLLIDGRQIRFKSTGAFLLRYKAQFNRDALKDLVKLEPIIKKMDIQGTKEEQEAAAIEVFDSLDLELFYNLVWVMAKVADPHIPEPLEWLDTFAEFPIMDIFQELQDVLTASIQVSKKK